MKIKKAIGLTLAFVVTIQLTMGSLWAEDVYLQPDPLVGATQSTLGRVFGVEGSKDDVDYYSADFSDHTPGNATLRSVLVPGWGQLFNGETTKGTLIMGSTFILGFSAFALKKRSNDTYDDYVAAGRADSSLYDDYEREHNRMIFVGALTALLWGFSIYDAHHNAYNPLWSTDSHHIELAADDEGAQVTWHQKF